MHNQLNLCGKSQAWGIGWSPNGAQSNPSVPFHWGCILWVSWPGSWGGCLGGQVSKKPIILSGVEEIQWSLRAWSQHQASLRTRAVMLSITSLVGPAASSEKTRGSFSTTFLFLVGWLVGEFVKLDSGNLFKAALCEGLALTWPACLGIEILTRTSSWHPLSPGSLGGSVSQWLTSQALGSGWMDQHFHSSTTKQSVWTCPDMAGFKEPVMGHISMIIVQFPPCFPFSEEGFHTEFESWFPHLLAEWPWGNKFLNLSRSQFSRREIILPVGVLNKV